MSSAGLRVDSRPFTGEAQSSVGAHTQARLYCSTNSALMASLPVSGASAIRRNTEIHSLVEPNVGVSRDAKICSVRPGWTQDERTRVPLLPLNTSAGKLGTTGTPIMIRENPAQGGKNHENGTVASDGDGFRIDENGGWSLGGK